MQQSVQTETAMTDHDEIKVEGEAFEDAPIEAEVIEAEVVEELTDAKPAGDFAEAEVIEAETDEYEEALEQDVLEDLIAFVKSLFIVLTVIDNRTNNRENISHQFLLLKL